MEVDIHFVCPCGAIIESTTPVPPPNLLAEHHSDSTEEYWEQIVCDACSKDFDIQVTNTFFDVNVRVFGAIDLYYETRDLPDDDEDITHIIYSTRQMEEFTDVMKGIISLSKLPISGAAEELLTRMLHVQVVTAVESYLSSTFIHTVINSEMLLRKLVETDPEISKRKFSLKEIFTEWESLRHTIAKHLKGLIFHDLPKVKAMYRDVLDIDFNNISWLFTAVSLRHDCVHRNGVDKNGIRREISMNSVLSLVHRSSSFVSDIDQQLAFINFDDVNDSPST